MLHKLFTGDELLIQ